MQIKGSRVVITGGSKGLGKATAQLLIEAGAEVIITGRGKEVLEKTATEIGAIPFHSDVANPADVESLKDFIKEKWGGLDVLINNAGFGGTFSTLEDLSLQEMKAVYDTNVFGLVNVTQQLLPFFQKQNHGNIINIASTAALKGFARGTVYSSSKFAVRCITQCWQAELRPQNIRVILVNPSEVPTAFGTADGVEKELVDNKLTPAEIAHTIKATLEMDDRGFIPEVTVFATNPWGN